MRERKHRNKKKFRWGNMIQQWVEPDIRDNVVEFVNTITPKIDIKLKNMFNLIGINNSKYYSRVERKGKTNSHNGKIPGKHRCLDWEREAIINYAKTHPSQGYRRLTYMMIDDHIVAVSPSTSYRVLKAAGLLNRWNKVKRSEGLFSQQLLTSTGIQILNM